ncbi:hypothetical protein CASFOL_027880 [Castilleja foliolosa]|uniref:F-box domain-containing protein n=1 Tax=Castilleja foliolosa TaxID=1961234 RepID=A0ABD3CHW7_9LAMI
MPPERNASQIKGEEPISDATADCIFPEEIMLCILTRLPVRSILRLKSVCKPWHCLFSTPQFIKMHQGQFSNDPQNQSVIFYEAKAGTMYLLNIIEPNENKKPTSILYPENFNMEIVGCCNGLFCLGSPGSLGLGVDLWNPALKLYKFIQFSRVNFVDPMIMSLGFGYDAGEDDFKVVRIVWVKKDEIFVSGAEVYSVNSDSWATVDLGFQFIVFENKNDLIVNGNPYWFAVIDVDDEVLVCFDVTKSVFKIVPLPVFYLGQDGPVKLVDWKGNLGALSCTVEYEVSYLDVWVFDDGEQIWRKNHTFGSIKGSVDMFTLCVKNGSLLGEKLDGKRIVFNPANGCVEEIVVDEGRKRPFEVYGYTESLTYIKGMKQVKGRNRKSKRKRKIIGLLMSYMN